MEKQKLDIMKESVEAQLDAQKVQIEKLRATYLLKKKQVDELTIRAGINGRMQEMTLQVGQRVKPGDVLAKVAQPWKLMARLQIAETQAKDILLGQKAADRYAQRHRPRPRDPHRRLDRERHAHRGLQAGWPAAAGAVPDLSVDGTVEIERLTDVLYIGRPVFAQPNSPGSLFRIDADGKGASRVAVKFGRASVNTIEIAGWFESRRPGDSFGHVGAGPKSANAIELTRRLVMAEAIDSSGKRHEGIRHR